MNKDSKLYKSSEILGSTSSSENPNIVERIVISGTTINGTRATLSSIPVPAVTSAGYFITATAVCIGGTSGNVGDTAIWQDISGALINDGVTTGLMVGSDTSVSPTKNSVGAAAWGIVLNEGNEELLVKVDGAANTIINWTLCVQIIRA